MGFLSADQLLLDEAQGVTTDMIVECIRRLGWNLTASRMEWQTLDKSRSYIRSISASHNGILAVIATHEEMTLQALLRKINPRLRPWPSKQAREEHRGPWLAVCIEDGTACMGMFRPDTDLFKHTGNHVLDEDDEFAQYWPCDAQGNKVRWPTDDSGNML